MSAFTFEPDQKNARMNYSVLLKKIIFLTLPAFLLSNVHAQSSGDYRSNSPLMTWHTPSDWQTWNVASSSWISAVVSPDSSHGTITIQQGHTVTVSNPLVVDQLVVEGTLINSTSDFVVSGSIIFENNSLYQHSFPSSQPTAGTIPMAIWKPGSTCEIRACGNAFQPGSLNQTFHHFIWNNSTQPHDFNLIANPNKVNGNFEIKNTNGKNLVYKGGSAGDLLISDSLKITGGTFILTNGSSSTNIGAATYYQDGGCLDLSASGVACTLSVVNHFTHTGGTIQRSGSSSSNCILLNEPGPATMESIGFRTTDPIVFMISKEAGTGTCVIPIQKLFVLNQLTRFTLLDNKSVLTDLQMDGTLEVYNNTWDLTQGVTVVTGRFTNHSMLPVSSNSTPASLRFNANSFYIHAGDGGELVSASWDSTSTLFITGIEQANQLKNAGQQVGNIRWNCTQQKQSCIFGEEGFEVKGNYTVESTGKGILHFPDCDFTIKSNLSLQNDAQLQLASSEGLYSPVQRTIFINGNLSVTHTALLQVGCPNSGNIAKGTLGQYRNYNLSLRKDFLYTSTTPLISFHSKNFENTINESYRLSLIFEGNKLQHMIMPPAANDLVQLNEMEYICNTTYALVVTGSGTHLIPQLYDLKAHSIRVDKSDTLTIAKEDIHIIQFASFDTGGNKEAPSCNISGILDMGMNSVKESTIQEKGIFQLLPGSTLITAHPQGIDTIAAIGCIQNSGTRLFDEGANYIFNGYTTQKTGTGLPSRILGSLTIDNSTMLLNGGVLLSKRTTIPGTLYLNRGKLLTTVQSPLVIPHTGLTLPEGGKPNSFVDGELVKTGLDNGKEFIFPLGNKDKWARLGITYFNTTPTDTVKATYFKNDPGLSNSTAHDTSLHHISSKEYWMLKKTGTLQHARIKLYWESGNYSGIYTAKSQEVLLARADTSGMLCRWQRESTDLIINGSALQGNVSAYTEIHSTNLFTFGSLYGINPLPIELLSFSGTGSGKGNILNWVTASEKNNRYFNIQRSVDGNQFTTLGQVNGKGNSNTLTHYTYFDSLLSNSLIYYRLKQVDTDGDYTYSSIIKIELVNTEGRELIVYPNPAYADIHILTDPVVASISIYNVLGKKLMEEISTPDVHEHLFKPDVDGIYFIRAITRDGRIITKKLIKK